jgi:hypothetical protein
MFKLAAKGKLKVEIMEIRLQDIPNLWDMQVTAGKRLVVRI